MSETLAYDVFLSHSSKDKAVVHTIAERLRADGLRVSFDEWECKPGDSIPRKTEGRSRAVSACSCSACRANAFGSDSAQLETSTFRFRDPQNREHRSIPLHSTRLPSKARWRNSSASTGSRRTATRNTRSSSMPASRRRRKHRPHPSRPRKRLSRLTQGRGDQSLRVRSGWEGHRAYRLG